MKLFQRINLVVVCELAGLSSICAGAFMFEPFVGFIVAGFSLLILSVAMGRGRNN